MTELIKNELIKLYRRKASWVMQLFLVLAMFGMAFMFVKTNDSMMTYYNKDEGEYEYKGGMLAFKMKDGSIRSQEDVWNDPNIDYEEMTQLSLSLEESISLLETTLKTYKSQPNQYEKEQVKTAEKELAFYQAYKENGKIPADPMAGTNRADFFSSFGGVYVLTTLFAVIVASMIIASEFTGGTMKLLLIRPYSRMQILWSKYIVTIIYGIVSSIIMVISAFVFSLMLPSQSLTLPLASGTGIKTAATLGMQLFGSNFLLMILYITIAFFFSAVIRSQALAVGVGMGVLFSGSILGQILPSIIQKYDWLKWIIFNLLGLNDQVRDANYLTGGNLSISATVMGIIVYIVLIFAGTLVIFNKRDVALS